MATPIYVPPKFFPGQMRPFVRGAPSSNRSWRTERRPIFEEDEYTCP